MLGATMKVSHLGLLGLTLTSCLFTSLVNGADPEAHMTVVSVRIHLLSPYFNKPLGKKVASNL